MSVASPKSIQSARAQAVAASGERLTTSKIEEISPARRVRWIGGRVPAVGARSDRPTRSSKDEGETGFDDGHPWLSARLRAAHAARAQGRSGSTARVTLLMYDGRCTFETVFVLADGRIPSNRVDCCSAYVRHPRAMCGTRPSRTISGPVLRKPSRLSIETWKSLRCITLETASGLARSLSSQSRRLSPRTRIGNFDPKPS